MSIHEKIQQYYSGMTDEHHRYRSWEHCYRYFHGLTAESVAVNRDTAALHLGFYLASWGMCRPSGFLFQCGYTVHYGVIDRIFQPQFSSLWTREFGISDNDVDLIAIIIDAVEAVRDAYRPVADSREATDTLVTKVMLGTWQSSSMRPIFHFRVQKNRIPLFRPECQIFYGTVGIYKRASRRTSCGTTDY
jgi:hypothetical protein